MIRRWNASATRETMEATARDGDFVKRQLANPALPRMLGEVRHRRVPDAGCGNELASLGCRLREVAEPGLDPAAAAGLADPGLEGYVHLPNFLVVSAGAPSA